MKRKYTQEEVDKLIKGKLYFNKNDLNIFVRRKGLYSWTMNFGNKWSWLIVILEWIVIWGIVNLIDR